MISIDSMFLFLFTGILYKRILVLSTFRGSEQLKYATVALVFILVLVYLLYDYLHKDTGEKYRVKSIILSVFFFFFIIYPTLTSVAARRQSRLKFTPGSELIRKFPGGYKLDVDLACYLMTTDSLFATEQAIAFMAEGKNPYTEDYSNSLVGVFGEKNPAFKHYVYLPGMFLIPTPFYIIWNKLFGWYDHKIFQLIFYIGTMFVLLGFIKNKTGKLLMLILFSLNPLTLHHFLIGFNETTLLFWILLSLLLLEKKAYKSSLICFAVACSLKQFSWFFIPFYSLRLKWLMNVSWKDLLKKSYPFYITCGIFILPFIIWDFNGFYDDIFKSIIGESKINFTIGGPNEFGVSHILKYFGLVSPDRNFPFWLLQVITGFPVCVALLLKQYKDNTLTSLLAGGTFTLFTFSLFSTSFSHVNYIGLFVFLTLFTWALSYRESNPTI